MINLRDALAVVRYHIIGVAVAASLVFGWILTGKYLPAAALACGVDWFFINLINRITDLEEDRINQIRGTELVATRERLLTALAFALLGLSFVLTHARWPALTPFRLAVHA